MPDKHGRWYWISVISFPVLLLALAGSFGDEPRDEAEAAARDLGNAVFKARYVLILLFAIAITILVYEATR
jgi:hypothetical protein